MSTSDKDDKLQLTLPESLERLEIVPQAVAIVQSANPFFATGSATESSDDEKLFGPRCECGRRSGRLIEHALISPRIVKYRPRRALLREPLLKYIGRCIHHSHVRHWQPGIDLVNAVSSSPTSGLLADATNSPVERLFGANHADINQLDFKSLVTISETPATIFRKVKPVLSKTMTDYRQQLCSSPSVLASSPPNSRSEAAAGGPSTSASSTSASSTSPSASALSARPAQPSCSQQAMMSGGSSASTAAATQNPCDVTIDELASYFETFVHIPKKMSSMAEMMYI